MAKSYSDEFRQQRLEELALGLTVEEVAKKNGISNTTVKRWGRIEKKRQSKDAINPLIQQAFSKMRPEQKPVSAQVSAPTVDLPKMTLSPVHEQAARLRQEADALRAENLNLRQLTEKQRREIADLKGAIAALGRVVAG